MRERCIKMLLDLGAEDLTKEMHPNKVGKRYLKIEVTKGSYIDFNFDYKEYKNVFVFSKRRNINKQIPISEIKNFLFNQFSEQKYAIFLDELETKKMGVSLDYKVGDLMEYDDGLPFENQTYQVVSIQKNKIDNTIFYYFKLAD